MNRKTNEPSPFLTVARWLRQVARPYMPLRTTPCAPIVAPPALRVAAND